MTKKNVTWFDFALQVAALILFGMSIYFRDHWYIGFFVFFVVIIWMYARKGTRKNAPLEPPE